MVKILKEQVSHNPYSFQLVVNTVWVVQILKNYSYIGVSILFGRDDVSALTGWIIFIDVFLRTCNRTSQPLPRCQQFLRCLFYRASIVPERVWLFSLRKGDLCLWKDQAALNWGIKNQRYLLNIFWNSLWQWWSKGGNEKYPAHKGISVSSVIFCKVNCTCKSHNAAFFHPSFAGLLNTLSISVEGSRLHHCCYELLMSGVFWTPNNVIQCCEKQG